LLWWLKAVGTTVFISVFFYAYFFVLNQPMGSAWVMPLTVVDGWVALWPPAFYFYVSLWFYTALAPALQPSFTRLLIFGVFIGGLCATALLIFYFFPTVVLFPALVVPPGTALAQLSQIDGSGNACPSLHVACSVFTACSLHRLLAETACPRAIRWSNWLWCGLIVYSTMAIKQHAFWDVLAGGVLGALFSVWHEHAVRHQQDRRPAPSVARA
jgi:hypothetical protein